MNTRLLTAIGASAVVVFSSPFVGDIRAMVQQRAAGRYALIVGGVVAACVAVAVVAALVRIRDRRLARYAAVAGAIGIGTIYARVTASGNVEVDAVEHFHFVEYGVIALLYYRVWSPARGVSGLVLSMLAGLLVGTADELLQWFVPARVGELRDIALNGVALGCGLLFGLALEGRAAATFRRGAGPSPALAWRTAAATILVLTAFLHIVHLGHEVRMSSGTTFRSRFAPEELQAAASERPARWAARRPALRGFAREDQYLAEGLWHAQRRNEDAAKGQLERAFHEDAILQGFFAPVLDLMPETRWPPVQRAAASAAAAGDPRPYLSDANPLPIYAWEPRACWAAALALAGGIWWRTRRNEGERRPAGQAA